MTSFALLIEPRAIARDIPKPADRSNHPKTHVGWRVRPAPQIWATPKILSARSIRNEGRENGAIVFFW